MNDVKPEVIQKIKRTRGFLIEQNFVRPGSVGAEVGVAEGNVSWFLLKFGDARKIHLIDPWIAAAPTKQMKGDDYFALYEDQVKEKYEEMLWRFADEIDSGRVIIHRMTGREAAAHIENETLDWVFIDDDHTYETTYENFCAFIPKVKPGGFVIGDDYHDVKWFKVIEVVKTIMIEHPDLTRVGVFENRNIVLQKKF